MVTSRNDRRATPLLLPFAAILAGCATQNSDPVGAMSAYPLILVVFFVACVMMAKAATAMVQVAQVLVTVLTRLVAALTAFATVVMVTGGGLWLLTLVALS
jgi:hypothetical protein